MASGPSWLAQCFAFLFFACYIIDCVTFFYSNINLSVKSGKGVTKENGFKSLFSGIFTVILGIACILLALLELFSLIPPLKKYSDQFNPAGIIRSIALVIIGVIALFYCGDLGIGSGSCSIIVGGLHLILTFAKVVE